MDAAVVFGRLAELHELHQRVGASPDGLHERYLYSDDMLYRYAFGRWWGEPDLASTIAWVMLNPATGDTDRKPRPTLGRAIERSRQRGATGIVIVNLFAFRATKPALLRSANNPVGPVNDEVMGSIAAASSELVAAWGAGGALAGRGRQVAPLLPGAICLGHTAKGEPRHPLYVPGAAPFVPLVQAPSAT